MKDKEIKNKLERALAELEKVKDNKKKFEQRLVNVQEKKFQLSEQQYKIALIEQLSGYSVEDWNNSYDKKIAEIMKEVNDYQAVQKIIEQKQQLHPHSAAKLFFASTVIMLLFIAVFALQNITMNAYVIYAKNDDVANNTNITSQGENLDVSYKEITGNTYSVSEIRNKNIGDISFLEKPTVRGLDSLKENVIIRKNYIWVNSNDPELRRPAKLSFYNLPYKNTPIIYRNDEVCPKSICRLQSYDASTGRLDFTVTGFSSYTTGSNSMLLINDSTDQIIIGTGDQVFFYANYSTTAGNLISSANCNVSMNATLYAMTYNAASRLYEYNKTFASDGIIAYNITCARTSYETLIGADYVYITKAISIENSSWSTAYVATCTNPGLVRYQPDASYASFGKGNYVYTTTYNQTGMEGNITQVEAVVIYYGPVSSTRDIRIYYNLSATAPAQQSPYSPISEGGTAATPLQNSWDVTSLQSWTWSKINTFYYEVLNDDSSAPDALGVDAIFLNITYKNYLPTIWEEGAKVNVTVARENDVVRLYNITVKDDFNTDSVFFLVDGVNYTATNYSTNAWQIERTCSATNTYNWTMVFANDTYNYNHWSNKSVRLNWSCDTSNPRTPNVSITSFSENSWLYGTTLTINCNHNGDVGEAGINTTSYEYQYNSTSTGGYVSICTNSTSTCSWSLPSDTYNITVRCRVSDLKWHNSTWNTSHYEGIDNTGPTTTIDVPRNWSNITTNTTVINATVRDFAGSGVNTAIFEYRQNETDTWHPICEDDRSPTYDCEWNVADLPDGNTYQVRSNANDSLSNLGPYDYRINITIDRTGPVSTLNYPAAQQNISTSPITLTATVTDAVGIIDTVTWEYRNNSLNAWAFACDDDRGPVYDCNFDLSAEPDGNDYQFRVWANDSNLNKGGYDTHTSIVVDRTGPNIYLERPATDEWKNTSVMFEFNATDTLSEIKNCYLMISGITNSSLSWPPEARTNYINQTFITGNYSWGINCTDALVNLNGTESRTVKIDAETPWLDNARINQTIFSVYEKICLNITAYDNVSGLNVTEAAISYPGGSTTLAMLDNGLTCDRTAGDHVFSLEYSLSFTGSYNWTAARANDTVDNYNHSSIGLNWTVISTGNLTVNMTYPAADIEINESDGNNNLSMTCLVRCNATAQCTNVTLAPQYNSGEWADITHMTTYLTGEQYYYACGNLNPETSCTASFNITSGLNSGNNVWELRCKGSSGNLGAFFSNEVKNLTINDHPAPAFYYPANYSWLTKIEVLNASTSTDSDGTVNYYKFEIDDNLNFNSASVIYNGVNSSTQFNTQNQTQCTANYRNCYLRLNITDNNGLNASLIYTFGIDNTGPNTTIDQPTNWTNSSSNSLYLNASVRDDGINNISHVMFSYRTNDQASWSSACSDTDGSPYNCSFSVAALADSKDYQISAYTNDSLNNVGQNDTRTNITVDRTRPATDLNSPIAEYNTSGTSVTLNFSVTDNIATTLNCTLDVDYTNNRTNATTYNNTFTSFTVTGFTEATHYWNLSCKDYVGNWNYSIVRNFTVDQTAPTITLNSPANGSIIKAGTLIDLSITDARGISMKWWSKNNGVTNSTTFSNDADIDTSSWSNGMTTVLVWANDTVGNLRERMYVFDLDGSAPNISVNEPRADYRTTNSSIIFNFTANDNMYNTSSCSIYINNVLNTTNASVQNNTFTIINISGINASIRNWTVNCTDTALNANGSDQRNFTIDWTKPSVTSIQPTTDQAYDPNAYVTIYATVSDNVMLDTVRANITWYISNQELVSMTDPDRDGIYTGTFSNTSSTGNYNVTIIANDTLNLKNDTEKTNFTVRVPLTNMGTPWYANVTDDSTAAADNNDASKNVTNQTTLLDSICNFVSCADADTREVSGVTAKFEVNWTNSIPDGSNVTDAEVKLYWHYTALDRSPETNSVTATFYYWNATWVTMTGCQNQIVPTTQTLYTCSFRNYITNVSQANNVKAQVRISQSGGGPSSEARTWINIVNLTIGYYDIMNPNVTAVNASPSPANLSNSINLSANITDNYNANRSFARVSYPNGTSIDYNMTKHGRTWDYAFSDTVVKGTYNVTIYAYDNSNLLNNTERTNFTINDVTRPNMTVNFPGTDYKTKTSVSINFNWTAYENYETSVLCNLTVNSTVYPNIAATNGGFTTYTVSNFNYGYYIWNLTCWDASNNINLSNWSNFTIQNPYLKDFNISIYNTSSVISPNTTLRITNQSGYVVYTGPGTGLMTIDQNQSYDIEIQINFTNQLKATLYNFSITNDFNLTMLAVHNYTYAMPTNVTNLTYIFAMNDSGYRFNYSKLEIPKNGIDINIIVHCTDFNFATAECNNWEVNNTGDYNTSINSTYLIINNITSFDAFGGGAGNTLPNLTNIRIYNVSGLANPNIGGTVIQQGLNTTFNFTPYEMYRIEFVIRNQGNNWMIAAEDVVRQSGLNSTWLVNQSNIRYNDSDSLIFTGGNFTSSVVSWNTTSGGRIRANQYGYFSYVVNFTTIYDENYSVRFLINDTSKSSGSWDASVFHIRALDNTPPYVIITAPSNSSYRNTTTVTFSFNVSEALSGLTNCTLILNNTQNKSITTITNNAINSITADGLNENLFIWSVNCTDSNGNRGMSVNNWSITIDKTAPSAFTLTSPANNTVTRNASPILTWQQTSDKNFANYTLQIASDQNFATILQTNYTYSVASTSVFVNVSNNGIYYWRVIAYDKAENNYTAAYFNYTTDNLAPSVTLLNPAENDTDPDGNVTFYFNAYDTHIRNCTLFTNLSGTFAAFENKTASNGVNYFNISSIAQGTLFHWNVFCDDLVNLSSFGSSNRTMYIGMPYDYYQNLTIPTNLSISNSDPVFLGVVTPSSLNLLAGITTPFNCSAQVMDDNGQADITSVNATFFHFSSSDGNADDNNTHYSSVCNCVVADNSTKNCTCSFNIYYFANNGTWTCNLTAFDAERGNGSLHNTTNMSSLYGLEVLPSVLDFGELAHYEVSNGINATIINLGNMPIDLSTYAFGVNIDDGIAFKCPLGSIDANYEKFSLLNSTAFAAMTAVSSNSLVPNQINLNVARPDNYTINKTAELYWKVEAAATGFGECNGTITFGAEENI